MSCLTFFAIYIWLNYKLSNDVWLKGCARPAHAFSKHKHCLHAWYRLLVSEYKNHFHEYIELSIGPISIPVSCIPNKYYYYYQIMINYIIPTYTYIINYY